MNINERINSAVHMMRALADNGLDSFPALAFAISQPDGIDVNEIVIGASAGHERNEP